MSIFNDYESYGHFYKIRKGSKIIAECRSVLDIIDTKKVNNWGLSSSIPNMICIMMNPGTSKPADSNYLEQEVEIDGFQLLGKEITLTIPDHTQKRLMKIMCNCQLKIQPLSPQNKAMLNSN
jgi:hypothetical protein